MAARSKAREMRNPSYNPRSSLTAEQATRIQDLIDALDPADYAASLHDEVEGILGRTLTQGEMEELLMNAFGLRLAEG